MTDNEIIKVLECCTTNGACCKDCPAFVKVDRSNCKKYFRRALDLINRQKAEIEMRSGHWTDNRNGTFTCSVCGGKSSKMDYCGRCGAYMRGDN